MKHRLDIDGLRAVAVLPVVLFHVGFSSFPGGFIGVDVFFVISGYLITNIIYQETLKGQFSFLNFYERRLRRIMPALLAVIVFVVVGSLFLLMPSKLREFPPQLLGTVFFAANIVLWRQSGYFSVEAEQKPLLHMWSLGVEEQFYIFAPIILILILHLAPKFLKPIMVLLTIGSFALCAVFTATHPSPSFYLLPTRAWELLAGALVAVGVLSKPERSHLACELLTVLGLGLIIGGMLFINDSMVFPGSIAAFAVVGTVLVILCGQGTRAGALLGWGPIRGLGLISYSLYLWHWPLIVFARDVGFLTGLMSQIVLIGISIIVAWLSWHFIEAPFRDKVRFPRRSILVGSAIGIVVTSIVAIAIYLSDGLPSRFSEEINRFDAAAKDISPMRNRCHRTSSIGPIADTCVLGEGTPTVAVWSDSHGVELSYALGEMLPVRQISYSSCPPALGLQVKTRPLCDEHNDRVLSYLTNPVSGIKTVVLANFFGSLLGDPAFRIGFAETVNQLAAAGLDVIVVAQLPRSGVNVPTHLVGGNEHTFPFATFETQHSTMITYLSGLKAAKVFDPASIICSETECQFVVDGDPVLFDHHHPSMSIARKMAIALREAYGL